MKVEEEEKQPAWQKENAQATALKKEKEKKSKISQKTPKVNQKSRTSYPSRENPSLFKKEESKKSKKTKKSKNEKSDQRIPPVSIY